MATARSTGCAMALSLYLAAGPVRAADWSDTDSVLLGGALVALTLDWGQTRTIAKNPELWHENNSMLGAHPSVGNVNKHFAVAMLGTIALSYVLPPSYRQLFLGGLILVETSFVIHNHGIGIHATF